MGDLAAVTSTKQACALLGASRATHYRAANKLAAATAGPAATACRSVRRPPSNALTDVERDQLLAVLNSERFADKSVAQTWAVLLDEGLYYASRSTMHP